MSLSIPVPLSPTKSDRELSQTLLDIIRRSVDGTVVPLFVDPVAGKVLIGTVVSTGTEILQVNGDARITGLLKTGSIYTTGLATPGNIWAGSLTANGVLQAGSAIIAGKVLASRGINALTTLSGQVDVASATAPSNGQVLTATGNNSATWQTPTAPSTPSNSYYSQQTFGGY